MPRTWDEADIAGQDWRNGTLLAFSWTAANTRICTWTTLMLDFKLGGVEQSHSHHGRSLDLSRLSTAIPSNRYFEGSMMPSLKYENIQMLLDHVHTSLCARERQGRKSCRYFDHTSPLN
jgi:hypothetical protein